MKTTQELRDYLKMTARPAQVEELVAVLNDLEATERRIAAAVALCSGLCEMYTRDCICLACRLRTILGGK